MFTSYRIRSGPPRIPMRRLRWVTFGLLAFIGLTGTIVNYVLADDSEDSDSSSRRPVRVAEEVDIFKQRNREMQREERREARKSTKKKAKKPPTVNNMFSFAPTAPTDVTDGLGMIIREGHFGGKTFRRNE